MAAATVSLSSSEAPTQLPVEAAPSTSSPVGQPGAVCPATGSDSTPEAASSTESSAWLADVVRKGLQSTPKKLPPYLFYDESGSQWFERITALPEYYLTRLERAIFKNHAEEMIAHAANGKRLRLVELGAGSADKTRTLLAAALQLQSGVDYVPVDVSATALTMACERLEAELPGVSTTPVVEDYTASWSVPAADDLQDQDLLMWIGSSIGNFEPNAAIEVLRRINATMRPGDCLLLGADLAPMDMAAFAGSEMPAQGKRLHQLIRAYDDSAQVTASFNRNLLVRLNRELSASFDPALFAHKAVWNQASSRIEMHLESILPQQVWIEALEITVSFQAGETIHTENSYKYSADQLADMMQLAGFPVERHWLADGDGDRAEDLNTAWFAVMLGRKH